MMKKIPKPREEVIAEEYFPVDEEDLERATEKKTPEQVSREEYLKNAIEKVVKESPSETEFRKGSIEKKYSKPDRNSLESVEQTGKPAPKKKRKYSKKSKNKSSKKYSRSVSQKKFTPQKINLKDEGYELIITEKPQAAMKIAAALGKSSKRDINKIPYYEVNREGTQLVVACAVGHLFTLKQNSPGSGIPVFDISWVPNSFTKKSDFTKKYYDAIFRLAKDAGQVTIATDYDVEGEVIGMNVMRFICGQKDANRMKFSTLTDAEINSAYEKKLPQIDWKQAIAGETRHYLDWFYGINLSRALMNAIKTTGAFRIMSIGRVQGPALKLIVDKDREISEFKSVPFWQIFITCDDKKNKTDVRLPSEAIKEVAVQRLEESGRKPAGCLQLKHIKDIFNQKELTQFENLVGKTALAETTKKQETIPPNPPFNLTSLQTEAYKFHGITPSRTLQAAQSLYLAGLISYPRTSSEKLPESIDYKTILKKIAKQHDAEKLITRQKPIEGSKTDPAHPSIYPTGETQVLSGNEEKIYSLIVKRFLALFCDNAILDKKRVRAEVEEKVFSAIGSGIRQKGWMAIYPYKMKEKEIPDMNGEVKIIDSRIEKKETQPPKRYSPASILSELEKRNLGTKATRAAILETLYDRGYVKDTSVKATPLGISLIETLEKHSPIIIDEELTRNFENEMESLIEIKKTNAELRKEIDQKQNTIIEEAKKTITKIAEQFNKKEKEIGKELLDAQTNLREQQKKENTLIKCPKCGEGNLAITYSRKNRRQFIACDAYPKCKNTFSLPPNSAIKKTDKICEKCKFPILMSLKKGKKPWFFCFNPECETNRERIEEYRRKKAEE